MGMSVKIYGYGWVGRSVQSLFPDALIHDPAQGLLRPEKADVAFVCVPTPNVGEGELDMSIVEQVVKSCPEELVVMRSTVNPGTCDRLEKATGKSICFMPEYLGETVAHPLFDETVCSFLVLGGAPKTRRKVIELFQSVYNANVLIRQVTNLEAEVVKLSENRAIAWKVAMAQELYDACEAAGVDYYTVREAVCGDDPRFNLWFTFVYPDKRGMDSKCIPKDPWAWCAWAESVGIDPVITRTILEKNKEWVAQND